MTASAEDEIEDLLNDALEDADAGEVIGSGSMVGMDGCDFTVEVTPGRTKAAITIIQKVLKKLKAPKSTERWEEVPGKEKPLRHPVG